MDNDGRDKAKKKEKDLTVKPYRHQLDESKTSLKQRLKVGREAGEVAPLTSQAAGHGAGDDDKVGLLVSGLDHVLKPVQAPPRGLREVEFYQNVSSSNDPECERWRDLAPRYYGLETLTSEAGETSQYLMLENLTSGMTSPCVLDIKVGRRTWGPDATKEKIAKCSASYAGTRIPFGFNFSGMVISSDQGTKRLDKKFGKSLDANTIHTILDNYLGVKNAQALELAEFFLQKLRDIETFIEKQTAFHVFGSSLLFIYDLGSQGTTQAQVRLIDFAHSFPANGKIDENYLFGLQNVRKLFENFIGTN